VTIFPEDETDLFAPYPQDHLATYLLRLPFALGLEPTQVCAVRIGSLREPLTPECATHVEFRLFRQATKGDRFFPKSIQSAAERLYGTDLPLADPDARFLPDEAYELWVSAETPIRRLPDEPDVPGSTLERCLRALDVLIRSYRLVTRDHAVYPVGPATLARTVPVGVRAPSGEWTFLMTLFMRPESGIAHYPTSLPDRQKSALGAVSQALTAKHPFLRGKDLELSARHQMYDLDDPTSAIVSLQTAVESTLFDVWRLALVDKGMSHDQVKAKTESDLPYKRLLTTVIPSLIGGRWDITAQETPVGNYWRHLYSLRNMVVHSAATVQEYEFDRAYAAHRELVGYIAKRLIERWREYPRTLAAFGNARGLQPGLTIPREAESAIHAILLELGPIWVSPHQKSS